MKLIVIILNLLILGITACSDFQLKTKDNAIICGRSMNFAIPMDSKVMVFNREINLISIGPYGYIGLKWTSKYGVVGINAFGIQSVDEGINEEGLSCGLLILDGTKYPHVSPDKHNISIAITDACIWILSSFSSVQEVKDEINTVIIWGNMIPELNEVLGLHIAIHDSLGQNLVIEFIDGATTLYDNPLGVLTNEPQLPYQLQNLVSYNKLSPKNPPNTIINGYKIRGLKGSGMQGIPGSWSSIDRFIRISIMIRYLTQLKTAIDGVLTATYILDSVHTPKDISSNVYTQWETMKDLTNKIFYYRNRDGAIRAIYLNKVNFNPDARHTPFNVQQSNPLIIDETPRLRNFFEN